MGTGPAYCGHCGAPLGRAFSFCPTCGASLAQPGGVARADEASPSRLDHSGHVAAATVVTSVLPDASAAPRSGAGGRLRTAWARRPRGRLARVAWACLVLLVLGVVLGSWLWGRHQDAPVRAAFASADEDFAYAFSVLAAAGSLDDLVAAGVAFGGVEEDLAGAQLVAGARDSSTGRDAAAVLEAERAVATHAARLSDLQVTDLSAWSDLRVPLSEALAELRTVEGARQNLLEDAPLLAADVFPTVQRAVGDEAAASASRTLATLFTDMGDAAATVDLRQVAARAVDTRVGIDAALEGFPEGSDEAERLAQHRAAYDALAGLAGVDADHLAAWAQVRGDLTTAIGVFRDDEVLRGSAQAAANAVDALIRSAQNELRDWRGRYDEAVATRRAEIAAISIYRSAMDQRLDRYGDLRGDLSNFIDRVEYPDNSVSYDEGYQVLSDAQFQRQLVRDEMVGLAVPSGVADVHNRIVAVLEDAISATGAAYEGTLDAEYCTSTCYYADTPGWQRFRSESSRITEEFDAAVGAWTSAVDGVAASAALRVLPERPVV